MGGESLPWPTQDSPGGGSLEELDEQLDDELGDFDETLGEGSGAGEEEIDILNPMGGSSGSATDQPVFEEADPAGEGGAVENESVAQRASAGASSGDSDSSGDQQGGASSSAGAAGAAGASAEGQQGNTSTGQAEEGATDIIPIPDDVGDGRNDDIVLRQIREAAMKEQDPVLRDKLWDEYRRIRDQR